MGLSSHRAHHVPLRRAERVISNRERVAMPSPRYPSFSMCTDAYATLQERLRRLQACVAHVACQTEEMFVDARPPLLVTELLRPEPHSTALASSSELFAEVAPCESPEVPAVPEEEPAVQEHRGRSPPSKATAEPPGRPPVAEPPRGEDAVQQQQQAEPAPPPPPRGPPPAAEDEERAQEAPAEVPAAPVQSSSQEAAAPPEPSARKAGRKSLSPSSSCRLSRYAQPRFPQSARRSERRRVVRCSTAEIRVRTHVRLDAGPLLPETIPAGCSTTTRRTQPVPPAPRQPKEASASAIEVPTWRVNHISSLYSMEGTENLDDEVFRKRHAKLEANEKRRKRWDLQLLREQQHTERLRRRMERSVEKASKLPTNFQWRAQTRPFRRGRRRPTGSCLWTTHTRAAACRVHVAVGEASAETQRVIGRPDGIEEAAKNCAVVQGTLAIAERRDTAMLLNFRHKDTGVSPAQD
ncbi:hypothetical protein MTO96_038267 [Rhipicephalus appendiculatus]